MPKKGDITITLVGDKKKICLFDCQSNSIPPLKHLPITAKRKTKKIENLKAHIAY